MIFFYRFIVSRIESKDFNFLFILVVLAAYGVFGFSTTYEDFIGTIFQPWGDEILYQSLKGTKSN
jgi:hypothetical protein